MQRNCLEKNCYSISECQAVNSKNKKLCLHRIFLKSGFHCIGWIPWNDAWRINKNWAMGDTVRRGVTQKVPKEKKPAFFAFTSNLNLKNRRENQNISPSNLVWKFPGCSLSAVKILSQNYSSRFHCFHFPTAMVLKLFLLNSRFLFRFNVSVGWREIKACLFFRSHNFCLLQNWTFPSFYSFQLYLISITR